MAGRIVDRLSKKYLRKLLHGNDLYCLQVSRLAHVEPVAYNATSIHPFTPSRCRIAKQRNTYAKRQRENEKRHKAADKAARREARKLAPPVPPPDQPPGPVPSPAD